ncbi:MAG: hypothetical protein II837_13110 [Treponema sp.]|nr:hypothetical protein [Treponema sp.]MBQ6568428.1 hypothetical protein [Treponema sp.]MBQ7165333.1 hypothetical protein [Treponema sp.]
MKLNYEHILNEKANTKKHLSENTLGSFVLEVSDILEDSHRKFPSKEYLGGKDFK